MTAPKLKKILLIQTAFIGDVILATPVVEALNNQIPHIEIDFLLRKGNESLLTNHPKIRKLIIWDKKGGKYKNLLALLKQVRNEKYDVVINLQRFASTGFFTAFSKAGIRIGFKNNPFALFFNHRIPHVIGKNTHETERNLSLLAPLLGTVTAKPKLYPTSQQFEKVKKYQDSDYICAAPTSVWFTKQFPVEQWISFFDEVKPGLTVYLLGAPSDSEICETICEKSLNSNIKNLAGQLSLLESAALMKGASMNFVNDSAPMHLASAVNAPTTAIFCSTIPEFGFGPLADDSAIVEVNEPLSCRPCGLHGKKACPELHFKCALDIDINHLTKRIK